MSRGGRRSRGGGREGKGRAAASSKMPSSVIWLHGLTLAISVLASVVSSLKIKLE